MDATTRERSPLHRASYCSTLLTTLFFFAIKPASSVMTMAMRSRHEDDVVTHHEGHAWCDSTERSMNYEIMTGRPLKS